MSDENKEKPLWKQVLDEFRPEEKPTSKIGKIGANIKTVWNIAVALGVLVLIIMAFTGKFDQLAYDMGIAGKPDSASHDYVVVDENGNEYDVAVDKKGNPIKDENGDYVLEDYETNYEDGDYEEASSSEVTVVYGTEDERKFLEDYGFNLEIFQSREHFTFVYELAKAVIQEIGAKSVYDMRQAAEKAHEPALGEYAFGYYDGYSDDYVIIDFIYYNGNLMWDMKERFGSELDRYYNAAFEAARNPKTVVSENYSDELAVDHLASINTSGILWNNGSYTSEDIYKVVSNARQAYWDGTDIYYFDDDTCFAMMDESQCGQYIGKLYDLYGAVASEYDKELLEFIVGSPNTPHVILDTSLYTEGADFIEIGETYEFYAVFIGTTSTQVPIFVLIDWPVS